MWLRFGRWLATRWRGGWPYGIPAAVVVVASEILDDENGDKSAGAWIASGVLGLAVLLVVRWVRGDPGADHQDERSS